MSAAIRAGSVVWHCHPSNRLAQRSKAAITLELAAPGAKWFFCLRNGQGRRIGDLILLMAVLHDFLERIAQEPPITHDVITVVDCTGGARVTTGGPACGSALQAIKQPQIATSRCQRGWPQHGTGLFWPDGAGGGAGSSAWHQVYGWSWCSLLTRQSLRWRFPKGAPGRCHVSALRPLRSRDCCTLSCVRPAS